MGRKIQSQGRETLGKETCGQKKINQKVRPGAGNKSPKNLCLIGKTINSCLVKESLFQVKSPKNRSCRLRLPV